MPFDGSVEHDLRAGAYDVVICHTVASLLSLWRFKKPRYIFCAHIPLWRHSPKAFLRSLVKRWALLAFRATHRLTFVATSPLKRESWRIAGPLIMTTAEEMPAATHENRASALVVCNGLKLRGAELGEPLLREIDRKVPLAVVGRGNGWPRGIEPASHAAFLETIRRFGVYLYPIASPWGDGYNIALLEAMKMGMGIVTVAHPHSPLVDGVSALVGSTPDDLAAKLQRLLADPDLARRLGAEARRTYELRYSTQHFATSWRKVIADPLVSVVVSTYNGAHLLPRTLRSVAAQSYLNWECLVVDDGSTDESAAVARSFAARDPRFRLISIPHSGFAARARNLGAREARGEFLAMLDHDDVWHPAKLQHQVDAFRQVPDAGLVHTARIRWPHEKTPTPDGIPTSRPTFDPFSRCLGRACRVTHSSVMMTRAAFKAAGGYREDLRAVDDYLLFLRLAAQGPVVRLKEPLTYVGEHGGNLSLSKRVMVEGLMTLAKIVRADGGPPSLTASVDAQAWKSKGVLLFRAGDPDARLAFRKSLRAQFRLKTLALLILAQASARPWRKALSVARRAEDAPHPGSARAPL